MEKKSKQPMITNLFKTTKPNIYKSIAKNIKENSEEHELDFIFSEKFIGPNKRIKIDNLNSIKGASNLKNKNEELSSKSTIDTLGSKLTLNLSSPEKNINENKNKFELSSKTKNIIEEIMNKKVNQIKKNNSNLINDKLSQNDNEEKLSFSSRLSVSNNKEFFTKKNEMPKLSDNAKKIIEKLKEERKNRFLRNNNNESKHFKPSDNSLSCLRLKYEELIKDNRELPLPLSYKSLYNSFISLENMINLNKLKSKFNSNSFDYFRNSIESSTHKKFDMKIFQQILYIVPHFYIIKYEKKNNSNEGVFNVNIKNYNNNNYDLIIDIPNDFEDRQNKNYEDNFNFTSINFINKNEDFHPIYKPLTNQQSIFRKKIFKSILTRIVNDYHLKFLEKNNIKLKFNSLKENTWHHDFDYEKECNEIPIYEIPNPPEKISSKFESTIIKNDIKSQILRDALSMVNESNEKEKNDIDNNNINKNENKILSKYISSDLLLKLRKKEEAIKISNEILDYNISINEKKDYSKIYREILIQMKTFLLLNKKSFAIDEITEKVWNCKKIIKETFNSKDELAKVIYKLCNKYSDIIKIVKHSLLGYIVVLNNLNKTIPNEIQI